MLLREMDQGQDFVSDLENILHLYLRDYDKEGAAANLNYETLNGLLQRAGSYGSVNRKIIDDAINKSDSLRQLVRDYDEEGITLNTNKDSVDPDVQDQPDLEKTDQGISKTTAQAASRAASKGLTQ